MKTMIKLIKIVLLGVTLFLSVYTNAQTIILKETVPADFSEIDNDEGPNRKKFTHTYIGFAFHAGGFDHNDSILSKIIGGRSFEIISGARFYRKLSNTFALTMDTRLIYSQYVYNLKQNPNLSIPVATTYLKKAKHFFGKYGMSLAFQINLKPKRGNQLGNYLQFGGYGNGLFSKRFVAKFNTDPSQYGETARIGIGKLKYAKGFEYGFEVGYGRPNMLLFARYRYSDYFNRQAIDLGIKELPRITIGFQVFTSS